MTFWPSDKVRTYFGLGLMTVQIFIPLIILTICYGKILWVLTRRINTDLIETKYTVDKSQDCIDQAICDKTLTQATDPGKDKFQLARKYTVKTLLIVSCCFIICWSQNEIMYFLYNCGYDINFNTTCFQFTILLVFLNCTVNPFIYLIKYRDYQEALKTFLNCNKKQESDSKIISSESKSTNTN